ncbi:BLOC-1-related complex subunit 5 [Neocloeon triangulifer]|uniref:BLOC-1-related complex subunit 5 n=1 Tax=Neocloeon triangulifer TaxID=2078957 RepID=UPI00286ED7D0|nr:BLOC-1-related complex subunit 5 [Neocloeon triangulifer]
MGNEHSNQQPGQPARSKSLTRAGSKGPVGPESDLQDDIRSASPGPSVCSDSELPYISYTVNRPIGDSPKLQQKHLQRGNKSATSSPVRTRNPLMTAKSVQSRIRPASFPNKTTKAHTIVVVKPAVETNDLETDEDQQRLRHTPMFLPIMRGTLNLPAARDPEVLERLDPGGLVGLGSRYQQHLARCSDMVATEQNQLAARIKEVDTGLNRLMGNLTERQKRFAKLAEKIGKVHEVSGQLNRCHSLLNHLIESMETLNNSLPIDDRLEPFVWTTG